MLNNAAYTLFEEGCSLHTLQVPPMLCKTYYFHNIRVVCQVNQTALMALLDETLGIFPEPPVVCASVTYRMLCYADASAFPVALPHSGLSTGKVRLLTGTTLRSYQSPDGRFVYQSYEALPLNNGPALGIIDASCQMALVLLVTPEHYQIHFLRRYLLQLTLGELVRPFGFEACHAAAVSNPANSEQGALILGASGSGKTTLSLGCAYHGYRLLGDDLVLLQPKPPSGLINACLLTREVAIRSHTIDLWPALAPLRLKTADQRDKRYISIEQLRPGTLQLQVPVQLLLFPSLAASTSSETTSYALPLSRAQALRELIALCMSRRENNQHAQATLFGYLSALTEQARAYRLVLAREATDGPDLLQTLFNGGHA